MKAITVFETSDGVRHQTEAQARRHLDEKYGAIITELAHALAQTGCKYKHLYELLESESFHSGVAQMLAIKVELDSPLGEDEGED